MDELKDLVTKAVSVTTFPSWMGLEKDILSTDAVTTILLECLCAAIADTISIQCINLPPIKLFKVLVSLGNTISVIVTNDSLHVLLFFGMLFPSFFTSQRYEAEIVKCFFGYFVFGDLS